MRKISFTLLFLLSLHVFKAQNPVLVNIVIVQTPCNSDGKMFVNILSGQPPYEIRWYHNNALVGSSDTLNNAVPGFYSVVVWDANDDYGSSVYFLPGAFSAAVSFYPTHCPVDDGAVSVNLSGGIAPYTFQWTTGLLTIDSLGFDSIGNLSQGSYNCHITDSTGCGFNILEVNPGIVNNIPPVQLSFSTTMDTCNDGTVKVTATGGALPYTYYWYGFPNTSDDSLYNLDFGTYGVQVTDSNNCPTTGWAVVLPDPNHLQSFGSETNATCPGYNDGAISVSVTGGHPPYSFQWSNGDTTANLNNLTPGYYSLVITDSLGCHINPYKYIEGVSNVTVSLDSLTQPDCGNSNGSISVHANGVPPFTYQWSNGTTSATAQNLSAQYYNVVATDSAGCKGCAYTTLVLPDSCYGKIKGYVYLDGDSSCSLGMNESGIANRIVALSNGHFITTSLDGSYNYKTLNFNSYIVDHTPPSGWNAVCPATYTVNVTAGSLSTGNDFYEKPLISANDLAASCQIGIVRPGFTHRTYFAVVNNGSTSMSGNIRYTHDTIENFMGASNGSIYNIAQREVMANFNLLPPGGYYVYWADFSISPSTPLNTPVTGIVQVLPNANDNTPNDNSDTCNTIVVGSYDPNDKLVEPSNKSLPNWLYEKDTVLTYTVRFQNTGSYPTTFIKIKDTLDPNLNITSFEFLGASHSGCTWNIEGPGALTLSFDSIALPGAAVDEPGSHGWVKYRIKRKPNLPAFTIIKNTAYIFFDYNAPVITNTTTNQVYPAPVGMEEQVVKNSLTLFPNPADDAVQINFDKVEKGRIIEFFDALGRKMKQSAGELKENSLAIDELDAGLYFIRIRSAQNEYETIKLLVQD